jgi:RNA-directed DNA polymerase
MRQRQGAKTQGVSLKVAWQGIAGKKVQRHVFRLQKRMYRAAQREEVRTVHKLQKVLVKSWYARRLAVRRMTQANRGKHTAGIDGAKPRTPPQRWRLANTLHLDGPATALRRIWIPKRGSRTAKRPLGMPTQADRARHTVVTNGVSLIQTKQLHWYFTD